MVNVLVDIIAATQRTPEDISPPLQSAVDALNAYTFRPTEAKPGGIGLLEYRTEEWSEIAGRIPEGEAEVIQRLLQQDQTEFTEALPTGGGQQLALPNDVGADPEIMLFEFSEAGEELVLEIRSRPIGPDVGESALANLIVAALNSPHEWLQRRRRRDCAPKVWDHACNNHRCRGECREYKKSDEDRTRLLCTCIY